MKTAFGYIGILCHQVSVSELIITKSKNFLAKSYREVRRGGGVKNSGADSEIFKRQGGGYVGVSHHGWPPKKILGFRWSKKAKITLEIKAFGETFLSVFSNFLHFYI